jgi:hypothetical protein
MTWKRAGLFVLAAAMIGAGCAAPEPAPWRPPADAQATYRGAATALSLSADGQRIAVTYSAGDLSGGVAVVDGGDGRVLAIRDYPGERISYVALSPRGDRILRLTRACSSPRECSEWRLVETDIASGTDILIGEDWPRLPDGGLALIGYDPRDETRIVLVQAPAISLMSHERVWHGPLRAVHFDRARPGRAATVLALGGAEDRVVFPMAVSPGGGVVVVTHAVRPGQGDEPRFLSLRPYPLAPEPFAISRVWREAGQVLGLTTDGRRMLGGITLGGPGPQTQEAALFEAGAVPPEASPATRRWLIRQGGAIRAGAISADGRRAALIIEPLTGSDPQPVLWIADLDEPDALARSTRSLVALGLGRTRRRAAMPAEELLLRLRAIVQTGRLDDLPFIERTLGLTEERRHVSGPRTVHVLRGTLAPAGYGNAVIYEVAGNRAAGAPQVSPIVLRLALDAGPCLTVADARRLLGEPEPGGERWMETGFPPVPSSHDLHSFTVRYRTGDAIWLTFRRQHCAGSVSITRPAR